MNLLITLKWNEYTNTNHHYVSKLANACFCRSSAIEAGTWANPLILLIFLVFCYQIILFMRHCTKFYITCNHYESRLANACCDRSSSIEPGTCANPLILLIVSNIIPPYSSRYEELHWISNRNRRVSMPYTYCSS